MDALTDEKVDAILIDAYKAGDAKNTLSLPTIRAAKHSTTQLFILQITSIALLKSHSLFPHSCPWQSKSFWFPNTLVTFCDRSARIWHVPQQIGNSRKCRCLFYLITILTDILITQLESMYAFSQ